MKTFMKSILLLLLVFVLFFGIMEGLIIYYGNSVLTEPVDYLIILGAKIWGDGPSPALKMRLDSAIEYWRSFPDTKLVVSGGQGPDEKHTEASVMKEYLIDHQVPEELILLEDTSRTTFENLKNSFTLIPETASIGVVSSSSHLFRAKMLSNRLGRNVKVHRAPLPKSVFLYQYIREVPAVMKSFIFDK